MRSYSITKGRFWIGTTGRQIRAAGSDAQLVSLYLFTGPHANAIGLYYLPFELLQKHLALPGNRIRKSLLDLDHLHFAHYDVSTEVVWVREMAYHQLGVLKEGDGRVKAASRLYAEVPPNPYLGTFFDRYAAVLRLTVRRNGVPEGGGPLGGRVPPPYSDPSPDPAPDPSVSRKSDARAVLQEHYARRFAEVTGAKPNMNPQHADAVFEDLLRDQDVPSITRALDAMFDQGDEFIQRTGYRLSTFAKQFNAFLSIAARQSEHRWCEHEPPCQTTQEHTLRIINDARTHRGGAPLEVH